MTDIWDPNTWDMEEPEYRVYLNADLTTWAVVDYVDYVWATRWLWHVNKPHPRRNGKKQYARRSRSNGQRYAPPLYLHVEIMKRKGVEPPDEYHTLVEHVDGNEFNCRRDNLDWTTSRKNRHSSKGINKVKPPRKTPKRKYVRRDPNYVHWTKKPGSRVRTGRQG
jgi:hypothetical protein